MESESVTHHTAIPVRSSEWYVMLDVLRGLALIALEHLEKAYKMGLEL